MKTEVIEMAEYAHTLRVAVIQSLCEKGKVKENLMKVEPSIAKVAEEGAELILLPELFPSGYYFEGIWDAAETIDGMTVTWMKEQSMKYQLFLGLSFIEAEGEHFYNTFVLTNPQGEISGKIRKETPGGPEAYHFHGEKSNHVIETPIGKIGVAICSDGHGVKIAQLLQDQDVDLMLMPHGAPSERKEIGTPEGARTEEIIKGMGQLYVSILGVPAVVANHIGPLETDNKGIWKLGDKFAFTGQSHIANSDGKILKRLGSDEGYIVAEVTLDRTRKVKPKIKSYHGFLYPGPFLKKIVYLLTWLGQRDYKNNKERRERALALSHAS